MKLKKGDNVIVITGKNKGEKGSVVKVLKETNRILVEGINKVKRHTRSKNKNEKGTIVERELPIHISNVMLVDGGKGTRVGKKVVDGKRVRIAKKSGSELK
jgi:large subunit ribosomal protein L24